MDELGITEYVKGDNRKFEIWNAGKEEVYIVQVGHLRIVLETLPALRYKSLNLQTKIILVTLQKFSVLSCSSPKYYLIIILCDTVKHVIS